MPQIINTNVASLNAQRNLNTSQSSLATTLQRLSSGLRINSAKDDAAGLAISERFTAQIRGLNQAVRNSNDGISLAQTAEGDLAQITNNLQRIRELAIQSANATNSSSDRAALQLEASQLISEIDRVASTSSFNGVRLLDGNFASQQFQVGANAGETVTVTSISSARTNDLGQADSATYSGATAVTGTALVAGDLTINGVDIGAVSGDAAAIAAAITSKTAGAVTASATNTATATFNTVTGTVATAATPTTLSFGAYTPAVANGSNAIAEVYTATTNYAGATNFPVGTYDFSTDSVSFQVHLNGGTDTVTLNGNYGSEAAFLTAINNQITQGVTATVNGGGQLVFTADAAGNATVAVDNFNGDVDAGSVTVGDFVTGAVTTNGADLVATTDGTFQLTIDGTLVYSEGAAIGGSVTAAELDTAIKAFADASGGAYTYGGGTSLGAGNLVLTKTDGTDVALSISNNFSGTAAAFGGFTLTAGAYTETNGTPAGAAVAPTYNFTVNGTGLNLTTAGSDGTITGAELATAIAAQVAGVASASYSGTTLTVVTTDGRNVTFGDSGNDSDGTEGLAGGAGGTGTTLTTQYGTISSLVSNNAALVIAGNNPAKAGVAAGTTALSGTLSGTTVTAIDISTVNGANLAIASVDNALTTINSSRASLGAIQNRFESVVASLSTTSENLSAARSRIRDADFASETANLTRSQILQQAGTAILAQANALPQSVLSLLR